MSFSAASRAAALKSELFVDKSKQELVVRRAVRTRAARRAKKSSAVPSTPRGEVL